MSPPVAQLVKARHLILMALCLRARYLSLLRKRDSPAQIKNKRHFGRWHMDYFHRPDAHNFQMSPTLTNCFRVTFSLQLKVKQGLGLKPQNSCGNAVCYWWSDWWWLLFYQFSLGCLRHCPSFSLRLLGAFIPCVTSFMRHKMQRLYFAFLLWNPVTSDIWRFS